MGHELCVITVHRGRMSFAAVISSTYCTWGGCNGPLSRAVLSQKKIEEEGQFRTERTTGLGKASVAE